MRRHSVAGAVAVAVLLLIASQAGAALVDFAIGAYGGAHVPLENDSSAGTVIGAKVRVLPPIPIVGFEAWYSHFTFQDPGSVMDSGDLSLALNGDGYDLYGVDVLIGGVRGVPGFKWYGTVGISAPEFEKVVDEVKDSTRKLGGQVGLGLEIVPPAIGLGIEARATLMFLDLSGEVNDKMAIFTLGANYYF
jgi:hypothetical protein